LPLSAFKPVPELLRSARRSAIMLGIFATLGGIVSLVGWGFDIPRLTDWDNDGISIQPNTAIAAACAGFALRSSLASSSA
jgi:hypothetical protein